MLFQRHGLGEYRNPNSWIFQRVLGLDFDVLSFSHRLKFQLPKLETAVSSIFSAGASGFGAWEAFPNHESIESIESQVTSLLSYHYSIIYITIILISYDTIIITILQLLSYIYILLYSSILVLYIYIYIIYILYYHFCHFLSMAPLINCPHPEAWNRRQSPKLCDRPFLGAHSKNIRRRPEKKPCRYFPRYFNFFPNIYLGK